MENLIFTLLTVPEVRQLFRQELAYFFASSPHSLAPTTQSIPDRCNKTQALEFLNEQGYKISKSQLYKKTAAKEIPFKTFGRQLIFSRKQLLNWVESQTVDNGDNSGIELTLAKSARRKKKGMHHA